MAGLHAAIKVTVLGALVRSVMLPKTYGANHLTSLVRVILVYRTGNVAE